MPSIFVTFLHRRNEQRSSIFSSHGVSKTKTFLHLSTTRRSAIGTAPIVDGRLRDCIHLRSSEGVRRSGVYSGSQTKLDLILKLSVLCHPSHRIQMYIVSKVEVHSGDLPTYRRTVHG